MSVAALAWAKKQKTGSVAAKATLMVIADFADESGRCWPSQAVIAEETELSDRSVRQQMALLEAGGFLTREPRFREDGARATDVLRLNLALQPLLRTPPESPSTPPERRSGGGRNVVPGEGRNDVPGPPESPSGLTQGPPSGAPSFDPLTDPSKTLSEAGASAKEAGSRKAKATAIPDGFPLTDEPLMSWAALRLGPGHPSTAWHQAELFANHARQEARRCVDWAAAWRNWITKLAGPEKPLEATVARPAFAGSPRLRQAVVQAKDEAWARSWLDPCGWRAEGKVIVAATKFAAATLLGEIGPTLKLFGWQVEHGVPA